MTTVHPLPVPAVLAALAFFTTSASAVTVIADNFDNGSISADWDLNAGNAIVAGGSEGTANGVSLAASTGRLGEAFGAAVPGGAEDFTIDYSFRIQSTGTRLFSLFVSANTTSPAPSTTTASINLRYQAGTWGVFDSAANNFVGVPGLPVVTAGSWYRMQVEGVDWGLPTASYNLRLSDANGVVFTSNVTGLTSIQNQGAFPITTTKAQSFLFNTAFGPNPGFDIDNITVSAVPEPGAAALAGIALLGLMRRRR